MTEEKIIPVIIPFTRGDYYRRDKAGRIELVKKYAAKVAITVAEFSWDEMRRRFEKNPKHFIACGHELQTMRALLGHEAELEAALDELETLRASMEDLCREMDRVRSAHQTFVMGPGVNRD